MIKLIFRILLLTALSLFVLPDNGYAQSRKRLKELEKMEAEHEAEADEGNEAGIKRHMDIQSKRTRKEMKKMKKRSDRYNNNKRTPFWKRWKRKRR